MRIAVMGSGALGGYFGGRLVAAGADVVFIDREGPAAALKRDGLHIESRAGDLDLPTVQTSAEPATVGPVDIVLFAVKLWNTDDAADACKPLIGPDTGVVCLQNGVTGIDTLSRILGRKHVIGGSAFFSGVADRPGRIRHFGGLARISLGELDGIVTPRVEAFTDVAGKADFELEVSANILRVVWEKFAFQAPLSGITALTRQPIGVIRTVPETRALLVDAVREVLAVARVKGVDLDSATDERITTLFDVLLPDQKSVVLQDLERGLRLEVPWLSGAVARLGGEYGVPTPVHRFIAAALAPYQNGAPA